MLRKQYHCGNVFSEWVELVYDKKRKIKLKKIDKNKRKSK